MGLLNRFGKGNEPEEVLDLRDPVTESADEDVVVDVREPQLGSPSGCDSCGGRSYVDHIDMRSRTQFEHCLACGAEWRVVVAEDTADADA